MSSRAVTLVTMQPISEDIKNMLTTPKVCIVVAKCEWNLTTFINDIMTKSHLMQVP